MRRALGVGEHVRVLGREPEAPRVGGRVRVVDLEEAGDRLLLEPLARVALVDPGRRGELGRRERVGVAQRPVEAEPPAEVDAEELQRADRALEEALDERVAPVRLGACHRPGRHFRRAAPSDTWPKLGRRDWPEASSAERNLEAGARLAAWQRALRRCVA